MKQALKVGDVFHGVRANSNMHQNMHQEKRPSERIPQMAYKPMV
jgi:hypothetical protein